MVTKRTTELALIAIAVSFTLTLAPAQAGEAPTFNVDHFRVYSATGAGPEIDVDLKDQFFPGGVLMAVGGVRYLLPPVNKDGEGIREAGDHLTCYDITPVLVGHQPFRGQVTVSNQFGVHDVVVSEDRAQLCVPSTKTQPPTQPHSQTLEHYKCYSAQGKSPLVSELTLVDQFANESGVEWSFPNNFCTPVDKNDEGLVNTEDHLTCYETSLGAVTPGAVSVLNQFSPTDQILDVGIASSLCVPSKKLAVVTTTTTSTTSTTTTTLPNIDHVLCYKINEYKDRCLNDLEESCKEVQDCPLVDLDEDVCLGFDEQDVTIVDRFGTEDLVAKKPKLLCPPVEKTAEGIPLVNPDLHLKAYQIKRTDGKHARQFTAMQDQFGSHALHTTKEVLLLVPTKKSLFNPIEEGWTEPVDFFKCYKISTRKKHCTGDPLVDCKVDADCTAAGGTCYFGIGKGITENLLDQFEELTVEVKKPKLMCAPAYQGNILRAYVNPDDHLMCYKIKRKDERYPKHVPQKQVYLRGKLGSEVVDTKKEKILCVRAVRLDGDAPTD